MHQDQCEKTEDYDFRMIQNRKTKTIYLIRHAESEENRRLASLKLVLMSMLLPWRGPWPKYEDVTSSFELLKLEKQIDSDVSPEGLKQVSFSCIVRFLVKIINLIQFCTMIEIYRLSSWENDYDRNVFSKRKI